MVHHNRTDKPSPLPTKQSTAAAPKRNTLSPKAEVALLIALASVGLFTAVVALAHTLTYLASLLGSPLFTLLIPGAALVFAVLVPVMSNPVHALLCLLGLFVTTALIYLSLGAEYLGLVTTLVNLGAVAILFLYVIMLLNVKDIMAAQQTAKFRGGRYALAAFVITNLAFRLPAALQKGLQTAFLFPEEEGTPRLTTLEELTGRMETDILTLRGLYTDGWPLFILITAILLIAMLGAIVLATGSVEEEPSSPLPPAATPAPSQRPAREKQSAPVQPPPSPSSKLDRI